MSQFLIFENPGILDIDFVRIMGVSKKDTDNAIGFFGTGLKYAIATILRIGGQIVINAGKDSYEFSTTEKVLRGETFKQVVMNKECLPFTVSMGKLWEPWMAVRELYSNALDEKGRMFVTDGYCHETDKTTIIVTGKHFLDVFYDQRHYFIPPDEKPIASTKFAEIYTPIDDDSKSIFYKGIRICDLPVKPKYRWNIKDDIRLTEDRTACYPFQLTEAMEKFIITCTDEDLIRDLLVIPAGARMEIALNFSDAHSAVQPSAEFTEVCESLMQQLPKGMNRGASKWLTRRRGNSDEIRVIEPTTVQKIQIARAVSCLRRMGYQEELDAWPIKVAHLGECIHGLAKKGTIYISVDNFEKGTKYLASTILEEFVHLKTGFSDHSRELQTWLFDRIITLAEEHILQEPL